MLLKNKCKMETAKYKYIDLTYLKQLSNGSNEFIEQMITIFMAQTPEALDNMERFLKEKDWVALRGVAHKMKPSFSFMGIKELQTDILLVEESAEKQKDLDKLPALISKIRKICDLSFRELEVEKKFLTP